MWRTQTATWTFLAATSSTAIAVLVNLATDWKSNVWAWVGVSAVTALATIVSWRTERIAQGQNPSVSGADVRLVSSSLTDTDDFCRLANSMEDSESFRRAFLDSSYSERAETSSWRAVDLKLINNGPGVAVIHNLTVRVENVILNNRPALEFGCRVADTNIEIEVINHGWGPAYNLTVELTNTELRRLAGRSSCILERDIVGPGESILIGSISHDSLDKKVLAEMLKENPASDFDEYFGEYCPLGQVRIKLALRIKFQDVDGVWRVDFSKLKYPDYSPNSDVQLLIRESEFSTTVSRKLGGLNSSAIYGILVPPLAGWSRGYEISHVVSPSSAERFHVLISSEHSGTYTVRLSLSVNEAQVVETVPSELRITTSSFSAKRSVQDGLKIEKKDWGFIIGHE